MILLLIIHYADGQIKDSDVGGEYSTYGGEKRDIQGLCEET